MTTIHDCLIVGGGAAGLSAALVLGRARRTVLLVDAGSQSNLPAHSIGGLLGHDRRPPAELYRDGRRELGEYPTVTVPDGTVVGVTGDGDGGFAATLADGGEVRARRVLLAGGMEYRYAELPGVRERWGDSVFHCPFCHGWEVRGRPLAVLASGPQGVHVALMLRAWTDSVTLLCASDAVAHEDRARLAAGGVALETRVPVALRGPGTALEAVELQDGGDVACGGLLVATTLHQRSPLAADLGVAFADPNPMSGEAIVVDAMARTTVPGVYAAGDVLANAPSVANAVASGNGAGAMIVAGLFAG